MHIVKPVHELYTSGSRLSQPSMCDYSILYVIMLCYNKLYHMLYIYMYYLYYCYVILCYIVLQYIFIILFRVPNRD